MDYCTKLISKIDGKFPDTVDVRCQVLVAHDSSIEDHVWAPYTELMLRIKSFDGNFNFFLGKHDADDISLKTRDIVGCAEWAGLLPGDYHSTQKGGNSMVTIDILLATSIQILNGWMPYCGEGGDTVHLIPKDDLSGEELFELSVSGTCATMERAILEVSYRNPENA